MFFPFFVQTMNSDFVSVCLSPPCPYVIVCACAKQTNIAVNELPVRSPSFSSVFFDCNVNENTRIIHSGYDLLQHCV